MEKVKKKIRRFFDNSTSSASSLAPTSDDGSNGPASSPALGHIAPLSAAATNATIPAAKIPSSAPVPQLASSSPSKTPWEKAVEKLKLADRKELNFDDPAKLSTLVEVLRAAKSKQQECENKMWTYRKGNGEEVALRVLVDNMLTNLDKLSKIVNNNVQDSPQPVLLVCNVFGFLLHVASNDMDVMGNLLSGLEYISCILGRCAVYEKLYSESDLLSAQNLINMLPFLYASILTYLCRSKCYFSRNTARRYAGSMIHSYTTEFLPLMEEVVKQEASIENAARVAAEELKVVAAVRAEKKNSDQQKSIADLHVMLQSMQQPITGIEKELERLSKRFADDERSKILKWLSEVAYERHHEFVSSARQKNTGHWLFKRQSYIEWMKSTSSSILWLHGIAGAGKTTLASLVVETLKETRPANHALAYFYCKYGEDERQDPESILRCIVKQLSVMGLAESLPEPVASLYREQKMGGFKSGSLLLDKSKELISKLAGTFEQTVIVIDALDECHKDSRHLLVDALMALRSSTEGLKLFLTSRNDDDILLELENEPEVYIQPSDNKDDIRLFATAEVERCILSRKLLRGSVDPELKRTIIETLTEKAEGMFLWVHLQIKQICRQKTEKAIRQALKRLPKDLEATYSAIWDRICDDTENNHRMAERTLKWVMCARCPLTPDEIIEAITIHPKQWPEERDHDGLTDMILLDVCQNLLVMDQELGVIRTAHFSVTEFLTKQFKLAEAHTAVAEICLTVLCYENHVDRSDQAEGAMLGTFALSEYVMLHWAYHIKSSGDGSNTLIDLQKEFLRPSPAYCEWLITAGKREYELNPLSEERQLTPFWVTCYYELWGLFEYQLNTTTDYSVCNLLGTSSLHLLAMHGYDTGLKLLLEKDVDPDIKDVAGRTPLHTAAKSGSSMVVSMLLEKRDVDIESKDLDGWTPLFFTAWYGHPAVARLLLEKKNVDLNAEDCWGRTPLHVASAMGKEPVLRLFLENDSVNLNPKSDVGLTPLHEAARDGGEAVSRLLIEKRGVDLHPSDQDGNTPLHFASKSGNLEAVKLLLARPGVDPNSENSRGYTPLYFAAKHRHDEIVSLLLQKQGLDLSSENNSAHETLYLAAAQFGNEEVAALLLERGCVDINFKDPDGRTPLYSAAQNGHEKLVKFLLEMGVDPNLKEDHGRTPLHGAVEDGYDAVVELFLEHREVELNPRDNDGWTPLHLAAMIGWETVARILIRKPGVHLNPKDNDGKTPLHLATKSRQIPVIRLLLEQDAVDLNSEDNNGNTPLSVAAATGHEKVVKILEEALESRGAKTCGNR